MKNKYLDLIEQTGSWPQEEFQLEEAQLQWHGLPLMDIIKQYGTPLRLTYLPKISDNIQRAKRWLVDWQTQTKERERRFRHDGIGHLNG